MDEARALTALLATEYRANIRAIRPLLCREETCIVRAEVEGEASWLVRVGRPSTSPAGFQGDAAVLSFLESRAYPAPRVVRAADGATVTLWEHRPVLVTTFIDGAPTSFAPPDLGQLGAVLGRLHALPLDTGDATAACLPMALMMPGREIAAALSWLSEVRSSTPLRHQARFDALERACHAIGSFAGLPTVLIHNDCHPGNSVRTARGEVVLIDWEGAGRGVAVIDVGFLLVSAEIEAFHHNRLRPDPRRVQAIVDGYCWHHRLLAAELDRLADAIRFRSVVAAADAFRRMVRGEAAEAQADWAWVRYQAADEITDRARERFEQRG